MNVKIASLGTSRLLVGPEDWQDDINALGWVINLNNDAAVQMPVHSVLSRGYWAITEDVIKYDEPVDFVPWKAQNRSL